MADESDTPLEGEVLSPEAFHQQRGHGTFSVGMGALFIGFDEASDDELLEAMEGTGLTLFSDDVDEDVQFGLSVSVSVGITSSDLMRSASSSAIEWSLDHRDRSAPTHSKLLSALRGTTYMSVATLPSLESELDLPEDGTVRVSVVGQILAEFALRHVKFDRKRHEPIPLPRRSHFRHGGGGAMKIL